MERLDVLSVPLVGVGVAKLNIARNPAAVQRRKQKTIRGFSAPDSEKDFFCIGLASGQRFLEQAELCRSYSLIGEWVAPDARIIQAYRNVILRGRRGYL